MIEPGYSCVSTFVLVPRSYSEAESSPTDSFIRGRVTIPSEICAPVSV